ncbi:MAG: UvrD-helicase domain-containing protein [Candidatus Methanomethylophilaceae archaeon]|nr:UvrD-helicase domain-containing protein [Candidatus Methanomethylophilaceae archaeon]
MKKNEELAEARSALDILHRAESASGFIEPGEPEKILESIKGTLAHARRRRTSLLFRLFGSRELKMEYQRLESSSSSFLQRCESHNDSLADRLAIGCKTQMPRVEGRELDDQQLRSMVYDVRNRLVVAGAGSGKTTTLVGLAKYLVMNGVPPGRILLLSFTNASVDELKERVAKETGCTIQVSTFHRLGLEIITNVEGRKPNISHLDLNVFVGETLKNLCENRRYLLMMRDYLLFDRSQEDERPDPARIVTMKGETVKSHGEKTIADFLFNLSLTCEIEKDTVSGAVWTMD